MLNFAKSTRWPGEATEGLESVSMSSAVTLELYFRLHASQLRTGRGNINLEDWQEDHGYLSNQRHACFVNTVFLKAGTTQAIRIEFSQAIGSSSEALGALNIALFSSKV